MWDCVPFAKTPGQVQVPEMSVQVPMSLKDKLHELVRHCVSTFSLVIMFGLLSGTAVEYARLLLPVTTYRPLQTTKLLDRQVFHLMDKYRDVG